MLDEWGFKIVVFRVLVEVLCCEDWVVEQFECGIDGLICNFELVKIGLDLLEFLILVYMQIGFNVYMVQQVLWCSWCIGQKFLVEVYFLGYEGSVQFDCFLLMVKKIVVLQLMLGDMFDFGFDVLNQGGDVIEVVLVKQFIG